MEIIYIFFLSLKVVIMIITQDAKANIARPEWINQSGMKWCQGSLGSDEESEDRIETIRL